MSVSGGTDGRRHIEEEAQIGGFVDGGGAPAAINPGKFGLRA